MLLHCAVRGAELACASAPSPLIGGAARETPKRPTTSHAHAEVVCEGLELAVLRMRKGERAEVRVCPPYSYTKGHTGSKAEVRAGGLVAGSAQVISAPGLETHWLGSVCGRMPRRRQQLVAPKPAGLSFCVLCLKLLGPGFWVVWAGVGWGSSSALAGPACPAEMHGGCAQATTPHLNHWNAWCCAQATVPHLISGSPQVPENAVLTYDVRLVDFKPAKESYEMSDEEKVRACQLVAWGAGCGTGGCLPT